METHLYTDDTVIYVHAKTKQMAAAKLTSALEQVTDWPNRSCLQPNVNLTVGKFFTKRQWNIMPKITILDKNIAIVQEVICLEIIIDPNLTFKTYIKK